MDKVFELSKGTATVHADIGRTSKGIDLHIARLSNGKRYLLRERQSDVNDQIYFQVFELKINIAMEQIDTYAVEPEFDDAMNLTGWYSCWTKSIPFTEEMHEMEYADDKFKALLLALENDLILD